MAIYPYKCYECGRAEEVIQSIAEYSKAPNVPLCAHIGLGGSANVSRMSRVFTVPMVAMDYSEPFTSPIDGTVITSKAGRREHMAKHGVVDANDLAADIPRIRQRVVEAQFADLKTDINEALTKLDQGYKPPPLVEAAGTVEDADVRVALPEAEILEPI